MPIYDEDYQTLTIRPMHGLIAIARASWKNIVSCVGFRDKLLAILYPVNWTLPSWRGFLRKKNVKEILEKETDSGSQKSSFKEERNEDLK